MKRAIFHKPGQKLGIEDAPIPDPGPGEVLIKVDRCGICGSDVKMTDPASPFHFAVGACPGHEYAGTIAALGKGVEGWKLGERVTAFPVGGCGHCPACLALDPYGCNACAYLMGGFGEYTIAQASLVCPLPGNLTFEDGALVEPLACGAQSIRLAGVGTQSRVLVLGAGATGLAATFWAARNGCSNIAVAATSDRRKAIAETMGATHFLHAGDALGEEAAVALGGAPDVVIECVGSAGIVGTGVELVAPRGTVVSSGMCLEPDTLPTGTATMKQVKIQFSMAYQMEDFRRAIAALDAGHVEPRAMVSETIPLDALPDMLETLRTDKNRCRVMVTPN